MERAHADPVAGGDGIAAVRDVVLLHGLWMPAALMRPLARRLDAQGFEPQLFAYRGRDEFAVTVQRLVAFTRRLGRPAHYAGHSLGGVLLFEALRANSDLPVATATLIAAPVRGSESARRLSRDTIGRWMLGRSRGRLCESRRAVWSRPEPLGIVVGTGSMGIGRLLGALPGESDGVVCTDELRVEGARDTLRLDLGHTPLLFSRRLADGLSRFFREGRFGPSGA